VAGIDRPKNREQRCDETDGSIHGISSIADRFGASLRGLDTTVSPPRPSILRSIGRDRTRPVHAPVATMAHLR
jgi:hypothetical protein